MRVEVQLDPGMANAVRAGAARGAGTRASNAARLLQAVNELGVTLTPVHPGQVHPMLAPFFAIEVPDEETAARVVGALRHLEGVESAYVRPTDEPA